MTVLEKVLELKRMGIPNPEIEIRLKNEGISPMEISDAMNQSKIKEAVSGEEKFSKKGMIPSIMGGTQEEENASKGENEGFYTPAPPQKKHPKSMESQNYEDYPPAPYGEPQAPSPRQSYSYTQNYESRMPEEEYYENEPESENYGPEGYEMNSDTMIEVAEQVFSEKIKKFEDELGKIKEFKNISAPLLESINERLKRIEHNFDKMQIAILERVSSFGKNIDSLKKEVEMVEDSFEKLNRKKR